MKYTWFNNEKGNLSFTVIHTEDGIETIIAATDTAEKADFISKACNQFSLEEYEAAASRPVESDAVALIAERDAEILRLREALENLVKWSYPDEDKWNYMAAYEAAKAALNR